MLIDAVAQGWTRAPWLPDRTEPSDTFVDVEVGDLLGDDDDDATFVDAAPSFPQPCSPLPYYGPLPPMVD